MPYDWDVDPEIAEDTCWECHEVLDPDSLQECEDCEGNYCEECIDDHECE